MIWFKKVILKFLVLTLTFSQLLNAQDLEGPPVRRSTQNQQTRIADSMLEGLNKSFLTANNPEEGKFLSNLSGYVANCRASMLVRRLEDGSEHSISCLLPAQVSLLNRMREIGEETSARKIVVHDVGAGSIHFSVLCILANLGTKILHPILEEDMPIVVECIDSKEGFNESSHLNLNGFLQQISDGTNREFRNLLQSTFMNFDPTNEMNNLAARLESITHIRGNLQRSLRIKEMPYEYLSRTERITPADFVYLSYVLPYTPSEGRSEFMKMVSRNTAPGGFVFLNGVSEISSNSSNPQRRSSVASSCSSLLINFKKLIEELSSLGLNVYSQGEFSCNSPDSDITAVERYFTLQKNQ